MSAQNWETISCPVCGGASFLALFEKHGEPFVRCAGCELVLINPRPRYNAVLETYDNAYTAGYTNKADKKRRRCRRWVARIQKRFAPVGRWLDIGCSAGFVVEAAERAGFDAFGIDVEAGAIAYAREQLGLAQVKQGSLEDQAYPDQHFNVISLYDVIEHVPDLNMLVATLKRLLHPAGVIEIRTPDVGHFRVPRDLSQWSEIKPSEHLYYFSRGTLARLLERHALSIVSKRWSTKPGLKIYVQHA